MNLVANAREAMQAGGAIRLATRSVSVEKPEAALLQVDPGSYVELSIADDGPGIPTEVLPRIFEPFFTTRGPGRGTGLGLPSVHGVVRQHRGAVTAANRPEGGAIFRVLLPAAAPGAKD